jgi:hypothetical protein
MKKKLKIKAVLLPVAVLVLMSTSAYAQKKKTDKNKFLDNKKYDVLFYEVKSTGRGKAMNSLLFIKGGKIEADLMYEKLSLPPVAVSINLDSTYTEEDTEIHLVKLEANYSEEKTDYKWEATITNYEIEGTVVQMKGGVERKRYEFSGTEKTKK